MFRLDTGSDTQKQSHTDNELLAENGSTIHTYGSLHLNLNPGLRHDFFCGFVIADINIAIIGSDLLASLVHYFSLDCSNNRLINGTMGLTVSCLVSSF